MIQTCTTTKNSYFYRFPQHNYIHPSIHPSHRIFFLIYIHRTTNSPGWPSLFISSWCPRSRCLNTVLISKPTDTIEKCTFRTRLFTDFASFIFSSRIWWCVLWSLPLSLYFHFFLPLSLWPKPLHSIFPRLQRSTRDFCSFTTWRSTETKILFPFRFCFHLLGNYRFPHLWHFLPQLSQQIWSKSGSDKKKHGESHLGFHTVEYDILISLRKNWSGKYFRNF